MERRTFVKGAFGFAALMAGTSLAALATQAIPGSRASKGALLFTTPGGLPEAAEGPLMFADIDVVKLDTGEIAGMFRETQLFTVDDIGATLMQLADGTRPIERIAFDASILAGTAIPAAEVAAFFVTLGQAGYLQNEVLVNLLEIVE